MGVVIKIINMSGDFISLKIAVICGVLLLSNSSFAQDILGCGGFLKSDVPIDFSTVDIKLYTKQGTLKESSDCAPTNGYYFIPLYDKGEYVLKIEPPIGWHFEPKEVSLNFDGATDPCSQSNDINFIFKGFTVSGKVQSKGSETGPEQVKIILQSTTDPSKALAVLSGKNGYFQFTPVLPGSYIVQAQHESYKLYKDSVKIDVKDRNVEIDAGSFVVLGYDVHGQVLSNGEPIKGVTITLYYKDKVKPIVEDCSTKLIPELKQENYVCHVVSNERGQFVIKTLLPGNYEIRPHYTKFEVQPTVLPFTVQHAHVSLDTRFQVKGFSVTGHIKTSPNGSPIEGARIYLNGEFVTKTDQLGRYHLDSMQPGTYQLTVQAENMKFEEKSKKISPNSPDIETIYPNQLQVCGKVMPSSSGNTYPRVIQFENHEDEIWEVATDRETGTFCYYLAHGKYQVRVKVSDFEKTKGLQYLPLVRDIEVKDQPINNVEFSQLKAQVTGKIIKVSPNSKTQELIVKLKQRNVVVASKKLDNTGKEIEFQFDEVMPGAYDVEVHSSDWCFLKDLHPIVVNSVKTSVPDFVQNSYKAYIISSHITSVKMDNKVFELTKGENVICVSKVSNIDVTPIGCHSYQQEKYVYTGSTLRLNAIAHEFTFTVVTKQNISDLYLEIQMENTKKGVRSLSTDRRGNDFVYIFQHKAKEGQLIKLTPRSNTLLFIPQTFDYEATNDCKENVIQFLGETGLILEGKMIPPLAGVKVTLKYTEDDEEIELKYTTQTDGKYKFGPLSHSLDYELSAEKESYKITGPDSSNNFQIHKLAEIQVKVVDNSNNQLLQGVLLSLTGGQKYRRNSITENGVLTFNSLSPGEYFLRPMMKEYKFEPPSQIIQVKEGATEKIELKGRRVAFSVYGEVSSLSEEPESNVVIEALGLNTCSNLQEEGVSENNGQFRIRGLLPQCEYNIRLKQGLDVNTHVHRITPNNIIIKMTTEDVKDLKLTSFQPVSHMDVTVHVTSQTPEHLKTLKLKLCKEDQPESPTYVLKLDSVAGGSKHWGSVYSQERLMTAGLLLALPKINRDSSQYFIQLESTLNKHNYKYKEPVVHFTADKTFKHLKIFFESEAQSLDTDFTRTNYLLAPFLVLGVVIYCYYSKLPAITSRVVNYFSNPQYEQYSSSTNDDVADVPAGLKRKNKSRKT